MDVAYIYFCRSQLQIFIKLSNHFRELSRLNTKAFNLTLETNYRWNHFAV